MDGATGDWREWFLEVGDILFLDLGAGDMNMFSF